MAAKTKAAGAPKGKKGGKNTRKKLPSKRTINLTLVNENRISPVQATMGIVAVLILATLFSKYLVWDRIQAVYAASARANQAKAYLDEAISKVDSYGEVEDTYAHYTISGMSSSELDLVNRVQVLQLMQKVFPMQTSTPEIEALMANIPTLFRVRPHLGLAEIGTTISSWSVSGNTLTVEIAGSSLESLNQLARKIEEKEIVDSCTITTANKTGQAQNMGVVSARFFIYLKKAPEEVSAS